MDVVLGIFDQLGADKSLIYQLVIFIVMFIISKFLFFNHLQFVIENREEKTVKLEGNAEKQFEEINKMSSDYKEKITNAHKEAKEKSSSEKAKIVKELESKYREHEKEINTFVEKSREEANKEIGAKKEEILSEAEQLANNLVQKLSRG
jgi:F-type H+-transporting ATPase subunit b